MRLKSWNVDVGSMFTRCCGTAREFAKNKGVIGEVPSRIIARQGAVRGRAAILKALRANNSVPPPLSESLKAFMEFKAKIQRLHEVDSSHLADRFESLRTDISRSSTLSHGQKQACYAYLIAATSRRNRVELSEKLFSLVTKSLDAFLVVYNSMVKAYCDSHSVSKALDSLFPSCSDYLRSS